MYDRMLLNAPLRLKRSWRMEAKAILYHSNKEDECKKFISKKDYLILSKNSKDDIWLGKGMYFWDNRGNANWWNQKQSRRKPNEVYSIAVVNADLCELLDLTDFDIYMKLEELWEAACKKMKKNSNVPLGNKLNFFFDSYGFETMYAIIKVYGKYNSTPSQGLFKFEYSSMRAEPTIGVKCIFNIRDKRCIIEKELVN